MVFPSQAVAPAPAAPGTAPRFSSSGAAPSPASEAVREAHGATVAKHLSADKLREARSKGGKARWANARQAAPAPSPAAGAPGQAGAPPGAPFIDAESVKQMVTLGLNAVDETLRLNMAEGWFLVTGDKSFAMRQAEFYGASQKQREAIALFAGLTAQKYQALVQYLPEVGLLICGAGYSVNWLIGFNKLRQAARLKAKAKTDTKAPAAPAPAPAAPPADNGESNPAKP